jgi:hypothetical protein
MKTDKLTFLIIPLSEMGKRQELFSNTSARTASDKQTGPSGGLGCIEATFGAVKHDLGP